MSTKTRQLGLCLLVIATLAAFATPAAQAFDFSYTESAVGGTMPQACSNAVQKIKDKCDAYGPITTDPISCRPIYDFNDNIIGYACICEATTTYCRITIAPQL